MYTYLSKIFNTFHVGIFSECILNWKSELWIDRKREKFLLTLYRHTLNCCWQFSIALKKVIRADVHVFLYFTLHFTVWRLIGKASLRMWKMKKEVAGRSWRKASSLYTFDEVKSSHGHVSQSVSFLLEIVVW